ncbi:RsfA family transcriptional regulator [Sutcliffiella cohnii]
MTTVRQDAWTQDEDMYLAEVVLRYIREGGTQLAAFEEVGRKLSRTSAACGFRWNSYVRKQYKTGIELAKKQRKELKLEQETSSTSVQKWVENQEEGDKTASLSIPKVIAYLQELEEVEQKFIHLREENDTLKKTVMKLEHDLQLLTERKEELERSVQLVEEDYKALIEIMDRARKMVVLQEEEKNKVKFQLDRIGSLEKVEK